MGQAMAWMDGWIRKIKVGSMGEARQGQTGM